MLSAGGDIQNDRETLLIIMRCTGMHRTSYNECVIQNHAARRANCATSPFGPKEWTKGMRTLMAFLRDADSSRGINSPCRELSFILKSAGECT